MPALRTFLDSGVLIAAAVGRDALRRRALAVIENPDRYFYYSPFVPLEVLPKAVYNGRDDEAEFYRTFFEQATCFGDLDRIYEIAQIEAPRSGLAAMDALHVAAAHLAKCEQFVTTEKPQKPLFRTRLVEVVPLNRLQE